MDTPVTPDEGSSRTQAALRQLADSAQMLVWMTDVNDVYIYLNHSAGSLFENGTNFDISAWIQFVHPDDLERISPIFWNARKTRNEYQVEYRIIRSDGSIRWVLGSGAPRFSDSGEFEGYNGTLLDVTDRHEVLERLAKSEAAHRLLTENTSDLISHHAPDGTLLYISPSIKRVLGFEPSELVGTSLLEHVHPDDVGIIRDEIRRQVKTGAEGGLIEFRKRHKDGHYLWMGTKARVLQGPVMKEKIGTVAVSRDVTFERQAKDDLRKREERFRSLTNLSSDWYWETDEHDRFTFISESVRRLFGAAPERLIGKAHAEIGIDPNQPGLVEYFPKLAKREPFKNIRYAAYVPSRGMTRHANTSGEPIFEDGVFKGYRGVARDVTDEVELAEKLARLAAENKALIENSLDIMALFDREGRILRVNEAVKEVLGYRPEEVLGRQYLDFVAPDALEQTKFFDESLRSKNIIPDFENRCVRKDGSIVHLSWAARWSDDKKLMYATARDVTERNRTRAALQQSKDRLHAVLESIGDAFFTVDREWRVTYANRKTADFIGRTQDAVIGKLIWEAAPEILASAAFPYYRKAMQTGEQTFFDTYYEPAHAWIEVRAYPHEDGLSVFFHDITDRRSAENAIRKSEQRFSEVIEMTPEGYLLADVQGTLMDVNPALCNISGYAREELIGQSTEMFFPVYPWDGAVFVKDGAAAVHGREAVIRNKQGDLLDVLVNATIQRDADGNALSLTAFLTDITERKQAVARLEQLATHDTLTGLPNRALLNERLQQMLDSVHADESIAVMFIDLDRFKEVNDSMGHEPGDILLREVARRLQRDMRPSDIVARLGGDEFVVAAHCSKGTESAAKIAEKLFSTFAAPVDIGGQEVFVGASIGISMFPQDGGTKELLFQNADTAMYRMKASGRNGYRFFESEMSVEPKIRMTLEQSLRRALERNEFELHYQPRLDLKTMGIVGMEALIRWNHPQLGRVQPLQFIPIAEERGLIGSIGRWVLDEACMQTKRLMDKFGRPLRVSVNLSARQLKSRDILDQVSASLKKADLPHQLLELELTESAIIEDMDVSAGVLKELKKLGILLSIDDFGTGYSGLSYLRRFPIDTLKLDRSFVEQQADGISNFKFIKAFVDLAHALNLSVVAEGVETSETLQFLREAACDEAQGYLFAHPLPLAELEVFLSRLPPPEARGN
jgi:diguanylate cyclase (GGDEF)-like protein/PAS domain S-box-containing protein